MMKTTTRIIISSIVISAVSGISYSCKQQNQENSTETKSLENFAKTDAAKLTVNTCGITYTGTEKLSAKVEAVQARIKGSDEFRNAALGAMEAVPENLMGAFFGLKGKIIISSKAESLCQNVKLSPAEKGLAGPNIVVPACWRQSAPGLPPEIVLPEDREVIRHSLLRMFSYVFAEAFVEGIENAQSGSFATAEAKSAAAGFKAERASLAATFLEDLKALNRPEVYSKMLNFSKNDSVKFGNYVYAEALDSYYCSEKSRETFESMFSTTWLRFTNVDITNSPVTLFGSK